MLMTIGIYMLIVTLVVVMVVCFVYGVMYDSFWIFMLGVYCMIIFILVAAYPKLAELVSEPATTCAVQETSNFLLERGW